LPSRGRHDRFRPPAGARRAIACDEVSATTSPMLVAADLCFDQTAGVALALEFNGYDAPASELAVGATGRQARTSAFWESAREHSGDS